MTAPSSVRNAYYTHFLSAHILGMTALVRPFFARHLRRLLGAADAIAPEPAALRAGLERSWTAWEWAQRNSTLEGTQSFGLLVLSAVCDCLKRLDALPARPETPREDNDDDDDDDW